MSNLLILTIAYYVAASLGMTVVNPPPEPLLQWVFVGAAILDIRNFFRE